MKQEAENFERNAMIWSLLMDISEKSKILDSFKCVSGLTYQEECESLEKVVEEDDASVWSIQVNASNKNEGEEEVEEREEAEADYYYYKEETEEKVEGELIDELWKGVSTPFLHIPILFSIYSSKPKLDDELGCTHGGKVHNAKREEELQILSMAAVLDSLQLFLLEKVSFRWWSYSF
ncbi:hypothetical protein NE237_005872 [Protea cynaroides]|uniref:Uncharacterized protein n=1 Tax=Protea cynaroides TaxID=273540 RepID=A0A9Q0KLB6_9MAGN|nr:hypothetical protein NE237_005872 [Protea cynaroides]